MEFNSNTSITGARVEPPQHKIAITGTDADGPATITAKFRLIPDVDFQLPAVSDINETAFGHTVVVSDPNDGKEGYLVTATASAVCGGGRFDFSLFGTTKRKEYTTTVNFTNNSSNTSLSTSSLTFTNPAAPNTDVDLEGTVLLNTSSGFYFNSLSDISLAITTGVNSLAVSKRLITEIKLK